MSDLKEQYRKDLEQAQSRLQQARSVATQLEQNIIALASRISLLDELEKDEEKEVPKKQRGS